MPIEEFSLVPSRRLAAHQNRSVFYRFFLPYSVLLILTLGLGGASQFHARRAVEALALEKNEAIVESVRDSIEQALGAVESAVHQARVSRDVMKLKHLGDPFEGEKVMSVVDAMRRLFPFASVDPLIVDYFVVMPQQDLVIGAGRAYRLSAFYRSALLVNDPLWDISVLRAGSAESLGTLLPGTHVVLDSVPMRVIGYIELLDRYGDAEAHTLVLLSEQRLHELFARAGASDGLIVLAAADRAITVTAGGGESHEALLEAALLADRSPAEPHTARVTVGGGAEFLITSASSSGGDWRVVAAQSTAAVLRPVRFYQIVAIAIIVVIMIADVLVAVLLARRASRPFLRLLQLAGSRTQTRTPGARDEDVYAQIESTITRLAESNERLSREFAGHQQILFGSVLTRLIRGDYLDASEAGVFRSSLGVSSEDGAFTAAIVAAEPDALPGGRGAEPDDGYAGFVLLELLRGLVGPHAVVHALSRSRNVVVLWRPCEEVESPEPLIGRIAGAVHSRIGSRLVVAIGGSYGSLGELYKSFEEAELLLRSALAEPASADSRPFTVVSAPRIRRSWFHLPPDMQLEMYNCLFSADESRLQRIVDSLYVENIEQRELTGSTRRLFFQGLLAPIARCLAARPSVESGLVEAVETAERRLLRMADPQESVRLVKQLYANIAQRLAERRNNHLQALVDDVAAHIDEHYGDSNLCLTSVASSFGVSTYYLSKLFPTYRSCNFSHYVDSVRMKAAREMLTTTDLEVSEIASRVGFGSANTFAKAFKRAFGVSATAYRQGRAAVRA